MQLINLKRQLGHVVYSGNNTPNYPYDLDFLNTKRFVFCMNTGRSGSEYLSSLFSNDKDVLALHEPKPHMTAKILRSIEKDGFEKTLPYRTKKKLGAIQQLLETHPAEVYLESSHVFYKSFSDVILKNLKNVQIVILRRNYDSIFRSCFELGFYAKNKYAANWLPILNQHNSTVGVRQFENLDQSLKIWYYLLDYHIKAKKFQEELSEEQVKEVTLTDLNSIEVVNDLRNWLKLEIVTDLKNAEKNERASNRMSKITTDKVKLHKDLFRSHLEKNQIDYPQDFFSA